MNKLSGALGLCIRSRNCVFGYENSLKYIKKGKSRLVLVSNEASEAAKKRIFDKCRYYNVEIITLDIKDELITLKLSDNIKIISINDINFKKLIKNQLKGDI